VHVWRHRRPLQARPRPGRLVQADCRAMQAERRSEGCLGRRRDQLADGGVRVDHPNACHDHFWETGCSGTSSASVEAMDGWLSGAVQAIQQTADYQLGQTLIIVTFDEGQGGISGENCADPSNRDPSCHVATIAIAVGVLPVKDATFYTHYSLLRSTKEALGITTFLGNAATANDMRPGMGWRGSQRREARLEPRAEDLRRSVSAGGRPAKVSRVSRPYAIPRRALSLGRRYPRRDGRPRWTMPTGSSAIRPRASSPGRGGERLEESPLRGWRSCGGRGRPSARRWSSLPSPTAR
jgi:hypothetical protein